MRAARYRARRVTLRDGREVTLRAVRAGDAPDIERAFERLSPESRYYRFMQHKKQLNGDALQRGVHPRPGLDFVFVATAVADDGMRIVGAVQYVLADEGDGGTCEFAVTVADDWCGAGLAKCLLASAVRRARRDGYKTMVGLVIAENSAMLALAHKLRFKQVPVPGDATVVRVELVL